MENASKALIIAGAILISILLIGVAMLIYSSATGTVDEAVSQMSTQEKTIFNTQFTQYEGPAVSGSSVKALINRVNANNAGKTAGEPKYVSLTGTPTVAANVVSAKTYSVTITTDTTTGLVSSIAISGS